jgi:hypothetical protein
MHSEYKNTKKLRQNKHFLFFNIYLIEFLIIGHQNQ